MNIEDIRDFCLAIKGTTECFPFDESTLVFKVGGKIYCLTDLDSDLSLNLKNKPEKIISYREEYPSVTPGYHMNKKYWMTVLIDGTISETTIKKWILESYNEVVNGLPGKIKAELK